MRMAYHLDGKLTEDGDFVKYQWENFDGIMMLKAGRLNRTVPDTCLQFWGGMGFTWENKVSRMYRDGRLASIGGGADEVMLGILAKMMGIAKRPQK